MNRLTISVTDEEGRPITDITSSFRHLNVLKLQEHAFRLAEEMRALDVDNAQRFDVYVTEYTLEKIRAIKAIRVCSGLGLKEAKDLVEGQMPVQLLKHVKSDLMPTIRVELSHGGVSFTEILI